MSKFKVGDRVRVVNNVVEKDRWVGEEFTITKINQPYLSFPIDVDNKSVGPFAERELELIEPTPEEQLAELEQKVAELKQQIEDAKPKLSDMGIGAIFREGYVPADEASLFIKVGPNQWVWIDGGEAAKWCGRNWSTDEQVGRHFGEVIREGI